MHSTHVYRSTEQCTVCTCICKAGIFAVLFKSLVQTWMNGLQQVFVGLFFCDDVTGTICTTCVQCAVYVLFQHQRGLPRGMICQVLWTWGVSDLSSVVDMGSE